MKVKIFDSRKSSDLERDMNEFMKDKIVHDVRQSTFTIPRSFNKNGSPEHIDIFTRVILMYDEMKIKYF